MGWLGFLEMEDDLEALQALSAAAQDRLASAAARDGRPGRLLDE